MARLKAPNGSTVEVADNRVEVLRNYGYEPLGEPKKAPAKKAAPRKSSK